jgi:hypothetical protein
MTEQQRSAAFWISLAMAVERVAEELVRSYRLLGIRRYLAHEKQIGKFKIRISVEVVDD